MIYKILADFMVALHLAWIVFLFLGAFWGVRSRRVKVFHLSGLGFAALIQTFDWYCPLTHLEVYLRARHNPATSYAGDFVIQYPGPGGLSPGPPLCHCNRDRYPLVN